ncbi:hypothetical protein H5P28_02080 [Ruficoccus amylovorans]|uniref:Uncharacterized protein n=1 Tax=Ruficoccus amylovorans TaxID=1804625 RepID=A0A842HA81_9BACT|nr:hypothetical protein [Ruficoccus amylovorans]MBC2593039.1 hypothetical protein [Ruficoccus amylovorans]
MNALSSVRTTAFLLTTTLLLHSIAAAQTYTPRLFTPKRTGDSYWFEDQRTVGNSTLIMQNGTVANSERSQFQSVFEANATVISNNAKGKATQERFTVIKFTVSKNDGAAEELLAPGTVFFGKLELGKKVFVDTDGKALPETATLYLSQIISLRDNSISDDDIFAPDHPVALGESWPVNADLAAEDFNFDMTIVTSPDNLEGTVTLLDADELDGVPCYHLLSEMEINRVQLPSQKNLRLIKGSLDFRSELWMPQQGPAYPLQQKTSLKVVFIGDPIEKNSFSRHRIMATSTVENIIRSKPLPRDESVMELDRTLGIRR